MLPVGRLNSGELVPFRAAINSGVGAVMVGHIGLPQIESDRRQTFTKSHQGEAHRHN